MKGNETFKVAVYGTLLAGERNGAEEHGRPGGLSEILPPVKVVKLAAHSIFDTYIAHSHLHILTELKVLFP